MCVPLNYAFHNLLYSMIKCKSIILNCINSISIMTYFIVLFTGFVVLFALQFLS